MDRKYVSFSGTGFTGASNDVLDQLPDWVHNFKSSPAEYKRKFSENFRKFLSESENPTKIDNLTLDDLESLRGVTLPFCLEHDESIVHGKITNQTPVYHKDGTGDIEIEGIVDIGGQQHIMSGKQEISLAFGRVYHGGVRGGIIPREYSMTTCGKRDNCKIKQISEYHFKNSESSDTINCESELSDFKNKIYIHEVKLSINFEKKKMSDNNGTPLNKDTPSNPGSQIPDDQTKTENKTEKVSVDDVVNQKKRVREDFNNMNELEQDDFLFRMVSGFKGEIQRRRGKIEDLGLEVPEHFLVDEGFDKLLLSIEKKLYDKAKDEELKKHAETEKKNSNVDPKKKGTGVENIPMNKLEGQFLTQEALSVNSKNSKPFLDFNKMRNMSNRKVMQILKEKKIN
jgi:hypothetical protein